MVFYFFNKLFSHILKKKILYKTLIPIKNISSIEVKSIKILLLSAIIVKEKGYSLFRLSFKNKSTNPPIAPIAEIPIK